jgi:hypothetical protein
VLDEDKTDEQSDQYPNIERLQTKDTAEAITGATVLTIETHHGVLPDSISITTSAAIEDGHKR